jgi:general secretion pathway protein H
MNHSAQRSKGFTLIEILVVLVIIAVMVSFAVLSVNVTGRDTQLDDETQRIEGLLQLLRERAALEGHDFGLKVESSAYEFLRYDNERERWFTFDDENTFRHRELPKGLEFALRLEARRVVLNATPHPEAPPQLVIAASGEATPFEIHISRRGTDATAALIGDALGKIKRTRSDQKERAT